MINKIIIILILAGLPTKLLLAQAPVNSNELFGDSTSQTDIIDVFKSVVRTSEHPATELRPGKVYFSFLPAGSSAAPDGGKAFITSTNAGFYLGDAQTTNLSSITFTPYFNMHGRFGLPFRSNIWLRDNRWLISGDTRLMVYPQDTWGLGGGQPGDNRTKLNYRYIRFYQSVLRRIKPYFFAGIGYSLDYHSGIATDDTGMNLRQLSDYRYGTGGSSTSSGVTLNLLYDTRNNSINPMPGCYANFSYRFNSPVFGSNTLWHSIYADLRKYVSLGHGTKQNTLAFWTYYWTTLDKGTPYLNLPSIGWDMYNRSGRGIEQNRYRGQGLLYMETEYRRGLTNNGLLGFVLFANTTSVTEPDHRNFRYFHPAGGAGLRIKFNKSSNTNIAIDYGRSSDYGSFKVSLGETF
jgi:hypothetical protein